MNTGNKWRGDSKVFKYKAHDKTCNRDFIVGYAGSANAISVVHDYYSHPDLFDRLPRSPNGLTGLVLCEDGDIFVFTDYMNWLKVKEPFHAIGSGMDYALGAMEAGKSPKEAVRMASKHDAYTGMGFKGYSF